MAIDTRNARFSMLGLAMPPRAVLPNPDASVSAADLAQLAYMYIGPWTPGASGPVSYARADYTPPKVPPTYTQQWDQKNYGDIARAIPPTSVRDVVSDTTIAVTDSTLLCDATFGPISVTLLPANQVARLRVTIKKTDGSANAVTIVGTVDGTTDEALIWQGATRSIVSNGVAWHLVSALLWNDEFNVLRYGPADMGDGTTTVQSYFNAAITAANAAGGGTVFVPGHGRIYLIDGRQNLGLSIAMQSNVALFLERGATLLLAPNVAAQGVGSCVILADQVDDWSITGDGAIVGDYGARAGVTDVDDWYGTGIYAQSCERFRIAGITLRDHVQDGIIVGASFALGPVPGAECLDADIDGVTISNCRRQGISVTAGIRGRVINSSISDIVGSAVTLPGAGIDFEQDPDDCLVREWDVSDCVFRECRRGVLVAKAASIRVSGRFIDNTTGAQLYGPYFDPGVTFSNSVTNASFIMSDATQVGVYLLAGFGDATGIRVRGTFVAGVYVEGGGIVEAAEHSVVRDVRVTGDGATALQFGVLVDNVADKCTLSGLDVTQCDYGVHVTGCSDVDVSGVQSYDNLSYGVSSQDNTRGVWRDVHGYRNGVDGIYVADAVDAQWLQCTGDFNQYRGLNFDGASSGVILRGCGGRNNSQVSIGNNPNILLTAVTESVVECSRVRSRNPLGTPIIDQEFGDTSYGIEVAGASSGIQFIDNDTKNGGVVAEIYDATGANFYTQDRGTGEISADRGDAAATLIRGSAETQRWATALTADRDCTLPVIGAGTSNPGMTYRIIRSGGGAFNLNIRTSAGTLVKAVPAASWATVVISADNTAWIVAAYGAL